MFVYKREKKVGTYITGREESQNSISKLEVVFCVFSTIEIISAFFAETDFVSVLILFIRVRGLDM
jgi:hypothetical protein